MSLNNNPLLFVALPCMNEFDNIETFISCLREQTYNNFHLVVCVNQPEKYYYSSSYKEIVDNNKETMNYLNGISDMKISVIDKSSKGKAWGEKSHGVGWARKVLFDYIINVAGNNDLVVSIDADTTFNNRYFETIVCKFNQFPFSTGLSVPYYHKLTGDVELNRLMLRYELYMRYYAINLWRISCPYSFTALGSAIVFPANAYNKIKGLAPKFSGEDFYLLQKLRKSGRLIYWNEEFVFPETRYSDRVFFGTGPALIKGKAGDWSSYPFYAYELFDDIQTLYSSFEKLFYEDISTTFDDFIEKSFSLKPKKIWDELRENNKEINRFIHACHTKFDGLRILQFLRYKHFEQTNLMREEEVLKNYLNKFYDENILDFDFSFKDTEIEKLDYIRNLLMKIEHDYRKKDDDENIINSIKTNKQRWKYLGS
jgi:hypothetical protein